MTYRKKLIEVALPLEAINAASVLEKQPFTRRHPRSIHIWWARRPFAAARAVIFAQMVDDPSAHPAEFPTEAQQTKERRRLFAIMEDLVRWENTANEEVLQRARHEIRRCWREACADNSEHPRAQELFDPNRLPAFHDPFAGGGALPLEAQRLGLESYASDLNPVAVLVNKAMIEIPPTFAGKSPVNPDVANEGALLRKEWRAAQGLAEDVRYYGGWMRDEAERRIGHLYPKVEVTTADATGRPDLDAYIGKSLTVIAFLWARTVRTPNPAFAGVAVPLVSTFLLAAKGGKGAYVEPVIDGGGYRFTVKSGLPGDMDTVTMGTKLSRGANFRCLMSGTPMASDYIKSEAMAGRMGVRLMAIVAQGDRGRVYLPPTDDMEEIARQAQPGWKPDIFISGSTQYLGVKPYGMDQFFQLFTDRQLVALTTFSDLVREARHRVETDALTAGWRDDDTSLDGGGGGAAAYGDAIAVYLSLATSRWADISNALCSWNITNQNITHLFTRQAIPMAWDFAELSPFSSVGPWFSAVEFAVEAMVNLAPGQSGRALQLDATEQSVSAGKVVSTDPPYYDNVPYADLSDFFYVWLRHALSNVLPDLFATLAVPKSQELVAFAYRHADGKKGAKKFFVDGMTQAMRRIAEDAHPAFPTTIYYAFKQAESDGDDGVASTGWDTFLEAVIHAGLAITGTWPMRTEREARSRGIGSNALASSIVLVCRPRSAKAYVTTRRDFASALRAELPAAVRTLQEANIAPVDLAQSAIGPGMALFSRYERVLDAEGRSVSVRAALSLINEALDELLTEETVELDPPTRWAIAWFDQFGFAAGPFGVAETLSKAKNTSVMGLVDSGLVEAPPGRVRLLRPEELDASWSARSAERVTAWEVTHQLIRALESGGEQAAALILAAIGGLAEVARDLAYRLYLLCERRKWSKEALSYNSLVIAWPELTRLAADESTLTVQQLLGT